MKLILAYPPKELSPNSRGHWGERIKPKNDTKTSAWAAARARIKEKPAAPVTMIFNYYPPKAQDQDNALARSKAIIDGLSLAWGVDDKHFLIIPLVHDVDKKNPRLEICVLTNELGETLRQLFSKICQELN